MSDCLPPALATIAPDPAAAAAFEDAAERQSAAKLRSRRGESSGALADGHPATEETKPIPIGYIWYGCLTEGCHLLSLGRRRLQPNVSSRRARNCFQWWLTISRRVPSELERVALVQTTIMLVASETVGV